MLEHMDTVEILLQHYGWLGLPVDRSSDEKEEKQPVREPSEETGSKRGS